MKNSTKFFLLFLIATGAFLRFYNLNWGAPYYFHPDERNIASSVVQMSFPADMNPNFFAYGSLPIYAIYIFARDSFEQAILISRIYSTIFSLMIIPILFILGKILKNNLAGLLAAFFGTFSVGLIQYAHFGTFEMWLTFFSLLLFYFCLQIVRENKKTYLLTAGIVLGILIGTKVSAAALSPLPFLSLLLKKNRELKQFAWYTCILGIALFVFLATNPFTIIDFSSFQSALQYESNVALGKIDVFYTQGFVGTIPIVFQFEHVYPFLLNSLLTILFIPSLLYIIFIAIKKKNFSYYLLLTFYFLLFFSQAFLYAKWTRYIVPTIPFIYLITAITLADAFSVLNKRFEKNGYYYTSILVVIILIPSLLFTFAYFVTVLNKQDSRISASLWAKANITQGSHIISEVYDLGITPFNPYFPHITLFNFYDLDQKNDRKIEFQQTIDASDYIILPSQRILKSRIVHPEKFPNGHEFYVGLFENKKRYKQIYQTPCDFFCKIAYLGDPIFRFEETVNVFDRTTVTIFKNYETK